MDKAIESVVKLKEMNRTAKRFYKDEYEESIKPFKEIIKVVMENNNLKPIPALMKISKTDMYEENGMRQLLFISATYDILQEV